MYPDLITIGRTPVPHTGGLSMAAETAMRVGLLMHGKACHAVHPSPSHSAMA